MFLLDTDVIAALRDSDQADPALIAWANGVTREHLFLSAVTLLDLENAAARPATRDKARAQRVQRWIDEKVLPAFAERIVPLDAAIVARRRTLALADPRDALIAATALEKGLTLATRRIAQFKAAKVKAFDPWHYAATDDGDWRAASRSEPHWLKTLFVRS